MGKESIREMRRRVVIGRDSIIGELIIQFFIKSLMSETVWLNEIIVFDLVIVAIIAICYHSFLIHNITGMYIISTIYYVCDGVDDIIFVLLS